MHVKSQKPRSILVVVGPTGTGKTNLALKVLGRLAGEIISADSRQVYKGLDYSTNKIGLNERVETLDIKKCEGYWIQDGVRINLYDVIEPIQTFSVGQFVDSACQHLDRIWTDGRLPVVVGGTGFYVDALLGISPYSSIEPDRKLRAELYPLSIEELQNQLKELDPDVFDRMGLDEQLNRQRLTRYIEVAIHAGSVKNAVRYSPLRGEIDDRSVVIKQIGLTANRDFLYQKADHWINELVASGHLQHETQLLIDLDEKAKHIAAGLIFKPCVEFLSNSINMDELINKTKGQLHRYIRRQMGWFKRNDNIDWIDISKTEWQKKVVGDVKEWYDKNVC